MHIGIDIASISRIAKLQNKFGNIFLQKFLSKKEQNLVKNSQNLAGLWAAKEAAAKALKCGICKQCTFFDIKISKNKAGAPKIKFSKKIKKKFHIKKASLSISHDGDFAVAVVVIKK